MADLGSGDVQHFAAGLGEELPGRARFVVDLCFFVCFVVVFGCFFFFFFLSSVFLGGCFFWDDLWMIF